MTSNHQQVDKTTSQTTQSSGLASMVSSTFRVQDLSEMVGSRALSHMILTSMAICLASDLVDS